MKLSEMKEKSTGTICAIHGTNEFQRRITAVGLTLQNQVTVIQNDNRNPMMLYVRNTTLAVNRRDSNLIEVEVQ